MQVTCSLAGLLLGTHAHCYYHARAGTKYFIRRAYNGSIISIHYWDRDVRHNGDLLHRPMIYFFFNTNPQ